MNRYIQPLVPNYSCWFMLMSLNLHVLLSWSEVLHVVKNKSSACFHVFSILTYLFQDFVIKVYIFKDIMIRLGDTFFVFAYFV